MNTLENILQKDLVEAMKTKDESRMSAIRAVKTAIMQVRTAPGGKKDLVDDDIVKIIQKQIKQREESISLYNSAGRTELAENEHRELNTLKTYVPTVLSTEETEVAVADAIVVVGATSMKDMGRVMKNLSDNYGSKIDRGIAASLIKSRLS